jgi:tetratricopeptide (TPR) repeat protein
MRRIMMALSFALVLAGGVARADSVGEVRSGNAAFGDGRYEAAIEAFGRAILAGDLDPEALAITFNNRGVAYSELGDYDRAIADYGQALTLLPGDRTAIKNLRIAHIRRAAAAARLGEQEPALLDYARAIELEPDHPLAYMRRGQLRLDRGDTEGAVADLTRARELDPDNGDIATLLADAQGAVPAGRPAVGTPPALPAADYSIDPPPATAGAPVPSPPAIARETSRLSAVPPGPEPGAGPLAATEPERLFRALQDVNLRKGPGNDYPRIGALATGTVVRVDGEDKGWLRVRLPSGGTGFVYRKWLAVVTDGGAGPPYSP